MSIFDLLFLALVLLSVIAIVVIIIALLRRRWAKARGYALSLLAVWIVYLSIGAVVAVATPRKILAMDDQRCFDEMCFQVVSFSRRPTGPGAAVAYQAVIRTSNRGLGHPQREGGATAWLVDSDRRIYSPVPPAEPPAGYVPSLDTLVDSGQSTLTQLTFVVPHTLAEPGIVIGHSYAFNPAKVIIGDDQHFLHKPAMFRLRESPPAKP